MDAEVKRLLDEFVVIDDKGRKNRITSKGSIAIVLQLTREFANDELPINPNNHVTSGQGQVKGLGSANLVKILADHGITRQLAKEAGRTSRGSMGIMQQYAKLINAMPRPVDFDAIEDYWISRVNAFFAGQPLKLKRDLSHSITDAVDELLEQADKRQKDNPGMQYAGSVLQHLVAAKLEILMPDLEIHGAAEADDQTLREGDFIIEDTAIHCTTAPGALLMEKCRGNIEHGLNPVIVTIAGRVEFTHLQLKDFGLAGRVEVWDLQQFLSMNVYEHGLFSTPKRQGFLSELVTRYNGIIDRFETDPSLRIEYDSKVR